MFRFSPAFFILSALLALTFTTVCHADTGNGEIKYSSETAMVKIDSDTVYWPEFRFWLNYISRFYKQTHQLKQIDNWNSVENGQPLTQFMLSSAINYACNDRAIEQLSSQYGIALSSEDIAEIDQQKTDTIKTYGSKFEYLRIVTRMYYAESVYDYLTRIDYLSRYLFARLYGRNGSRVTDKQIDDYVQNRQYRRAKYIFLGNTEIGGQARTEQQRQHNFDQLLTLRKQLDAADDPVTLFNQLVQQYSEDVDSISYPDGHLFLPGAMPAAFETAYEQLNNNEYSNVVRSDNGDYLILRLPITADIAVNGTQKSLRYWTAYDYLFKNRITTECRKMAIQPLQAYQTLDLSKTIH